MAIDTGSRDKMLLVCHVISQDHVIKGSCNYIGRSPSVFCLSVLQFKNPKKELRSNNNSQFTIEAGKHDKDFATIMSNNFNELPLHIRQITERNKFIDTFRTYLLHTAKEKYFI